MADPERSSNVSARDGAREISAREAARDMAAREGAREMPARDGARSCAHPPKNFGDHRRGCAILWSVFEPSYTNENEHVQDIFASLHKLFVKIIDYKRLQVSGRHAPCGECYDGMHERTIIRKYYYMYAHLIDCHREW